MSANRILDVLHAWETAMEITPELREQAKTCAVCRAQLMLIEPEGSDVRTQ